MKPKPSLFNAIRRIGEVELKLRQLSWLWVCIILLAAAVLGLGYTIKFGHFP